jgi:hypothetical protein
VLVSTVVKARAACCRGTESYLAPELYGYSSEKCTNKVDIYRCRPSAPASCLRPLPAQLSL